MRREVETMAVLVVVPVLLLLGLGLAWLWIAASRPHDSWWRPLAVLSLLAVSGLAIAALVLLVRGVLRLAIDPLGQLAGAALQIATSGQARIMDADRDDEIGELARALQAWKDASAERQVLLDRAPIGICRVDGAGRIITANAALHAMYREGNRPLVGLPWQDLMHPEDRHQQHAANKALFDQHLDLFRVEARMLRGDGSHLWCSMTVAPLPGMNDGHKSFILIVEDVSERKGYAELAARIQQELLPHVAPHVHGYEVAAACLSALEVAGDFYDWTLCDDGQLLLTVADVMGKGMAAALVMATVRAVLRAAPSGLGPAARVRLAADAMVGTESGMFVTLFHGSLDPASGVLRYVDAGHGYSLILSPGCEPVRLQGRSLPLGVLPDEEFQEGVAQLDPGDQLIIYSDGLVETEERTLEPRELVSGLDQSMGATEIVRQLIAGMPRRLLDDVTVVSLCRRSDGDP
jgi:PAS domain S-box-containing protein